MWFFTGKGDSGVTHLYDGSKVKKDNPTLELIGAIDEVNAYIGLAMSFIGQPLIKKDLQIIQKTLSKIMGVISGASEPLIYKLDIGKSIKWLEGKIIYYGNELDNPKSFTFSGKTTAGAALDICRTVSRRMERRAVGYLRENPKIDTNILAYLNRLSSLFYILCLFVDEEIELSR
ncbi:MAG: cob(I)yrinic acid a,c-diamide adenosyltransferase [Anaerolineaceae bacterium]|nr:cob(I)yrinic acid a,c-diamide adenosyltransferase [Anaerolineaceae bacterium]